MHRALLEARSTPGAAVVVEAVAVPGPELDDGILRAGAQAAVTLEAVAAGEAALRLEDGRRAWEFAANDLICSSALCVQDLLYFGSSDGNGHGWLPR